MTIGNIMNQENMYAELEKEIRKQTEQELENTLIWNNKNSRELIEKTAREYDVPLETVKQLLAWAHRTRNTRKRYGKDSSETTFKKIFDNWNE